jgi:hypothetical protein
MEDLNWLENKPIILILNNFEVFKKNCTKAEKIMKAFKIIAKYWLLKNRRFDIYYS